MLVGIVVEEGWTGITRLLKVSIRQQARFDKGLETITDTDDEASFSINWSIAERTLAFRKIVTINLADPSGSSAAENPPAKNRIFALAILSTIVSTEFSMLSASKVTNGTRLTFAPACSKALAESYSELVPGKTGM